MRALSWSEHLRYNHTPYRRDCRVCQETLQKQRPHRRIENPWAGILSLDTAGPFQIGRDFQGKGKYLLVGAYTWLVPKGDERLKEPEEGEVPGDAPILEGDEVERTMKKEENMKKLKGELMSILRSVTKKTRAMNWRFASFGW